VKYLTTEKYELNLKKRKVLYIQKVYYKSKKFKIDENRFFHFTVYLLEPNDFYPTKPVIVLTIGKQSIRIVLNHPDDFFGLIYDLAVSYKLEFRDELLTTFNKQISQKNQCIHKGSTQCNITTQNNTVTLGENPEIQKLGKKGEKEEDKKDIDNTKEIAVK